MLRLVFWYWFFVGPALLLAWLSLRGERKRAAYVAARLSQSPHRRTPTRHRHRAHQGRRRRLARESGGVGLAGLSGLRADRGGAHGARTFRRAFCRRASAWCWRTATIRTRARRCRTCSRRCARRGATARFMRLPIPTGGPVPAGCGRWWRRWAKQGVGAATGFRWFTPGAADVLDADAQRVGRGGGGPPGARRQPVRVGRGHGDPPRSVRARRAWRSTGRTPSATITRWRRRCMPPG